MTIALALALLAWGTMVALDLATTPQGLLSRPLVAATVTGCLVGEIELGLLVGAVLELYALEVMPVGASRYPDLGVGAIPAVVAAMGAPEGAALGMAGVVGLPLALLGGWGLHLVRRSNARAVEVRRARVAAGDARAIWELQRDGFLRDAIRGVAVTATGLLFATTLLMLPWEWAARDQLLNMAVVAGGLAAASAGAVRRAGPGPRRHWLGVGLATGLIVVFWR